MSDISLDYWRTVEMQELVYEGQKWNKISYYFTKLFTIPLFVVFCYYINVEQLEGTPRSLDYFIAYFLPALLLIIFVWRTYDEIHRDKLKEIEISIPSHKIREKLLKAAENLNWRVCNDSKYFLKFKVDGFLRYDDQIIYLIFFPDNRVFFNSRNSFHPYSGTAKFNHHYERFVTEYRKL